jgi:para-nitrobenzyl esterase
MKRLIIVTLAFLLMSVIGFIGCSKEAAPSPASAPYDDPREIDTGHVSGKVYGEPGKEVYVYLGIPYAAPPVGNLRWKPPQPAAAWSGTRKCTSFCDLCPQPFMFGPNLAGTKSDDCLYVNVMTPAKTNADRMPVMVWLHPGGYLYGTANEPIFNGIKLPQYGIVQVNVNHRNGAMGLLAHPLLSQESSEGVSGNYMFLDIIAALQWVQRNITAFGGDPDNVTIFGESGGSWKGISLMASPLAKGLFHKVIGQSGTPTGSYAGAATPLPLQEMEALGERLFAKLGIDDEADPLAAARALPWEEIVEAEMALGKEIGVTQAMWGVFDLAVDGWFMPDTPLNIFKAGKQQHPVPFIMGGTLGEITDKWGDPLGLSPLRMPGIVPDYVTMFKSAKDMGVKSWAYVFAQVPSKWKEAGMIAPHALDLMYVFGHIGNPDMWNNMFFMFGATNPNSGATIEDLLVSQSMMRMWTQFAKTGDPNVEGLINWPAYDATTDEYLYIAEPMEVKSGFSEVGQESRQPVN